VHRASREKARGNREVARERGRESRHLGPRESTGKLFNFASSEVTRERDRDSAEVPIEVTGVDGSSHTCASESRCLGHRRLENQKFGIASSEVASSEILQGKVSELTDHRVAGIRGPSVQPLDSRSREFRSSEKLRKGIVRRRESVGRKIPDRELGEPLSSSGRGKRRSW
jgi:hypothetical protein